MRSVGAPAVSQTATGTLVGGPFYLPGVSRPAEIALFRPCFCRPMLADTLRPRADSAAARYAVHLRTSGNKAPLALKNPLRSPRRVRVRLWRLSTMDRRSKAAGTRRGLGGAEHPFEPSFTAQFRPTGRQSGYPSTNVRSRIGWAPPTSRALSAHDRAEFKKNSGNCIRRQARAGSGLRAHDGWTTSSIGPRILRIEVEVRWDWWRPRAWPKPSTSETGAPHDPHCRIPVGNRRPLRRRFL